MSFIDCSNQIEYNNKVENSHSSVLYGVFLYYLHNYELKEMQKINVLRWLGVIAITFIVGKLFSKIKLPAILGWLVAGMIYGPHMVGFMPQELLDAQWYQTIIHVAECFVGVMIGVELVWNKLKRSGKQIVVTTLTQSLGTFAIVSLVFGIVFYFMNIPMYLAIIFGSIALATAPAPALSIVEEFKTDGPVTKTLIPMAALDDMVGVVVFFTAISIITSYLSGGGMPAYMIPVIVLLPLVIGAVIGVPAGFLLKKDYGKAVTLLVMCFGLVAVSIVGILLNNYVMPSPLLNFMLMGGVFRRDCQCGFRGTLVADYRGVSSAFGNSNFACNRQSRRTA